MNDTNNIEFISIAELCTVLGIGNSTAYKLLQNHQIDAFKLAKKWKIPKSSIEDFVSKQLTV